MTDQTSQTVPTPPIRRQVLGHTLSNDDDVIPLDKIRKLRDQAFTHHDRCVQQYGRSLTREIEKVILSEFPHAHTITVNPVFDYLPEADTMTMYLVAEDVMVDDFVIARLPESHPVQTLIMEFSTISQHKNMRLHLGTGLWDAILDDTNQRRR